MLIATLEERPIWALYRTLTGTYNEDCASDQGICAAFCARWDEIFKAYLEDWIERSDGMDPIPNRHTYWRKAARLYWVTRVLVNSWGFIPQRFLPQGGDIIRSTKDLPAPILQTMLEWLDPQDKRKVIDIWAILDLSKSMVSNEAMRIRAEKLQKEAV